MALMGVPQLGFPVYLPKGEMVAVGGECYVMPEPAAFRTAKDLAHYIFNQGIPPEAEKGYCVIRVDGIKEAEAADAADSDKHKTGTGALLSAALRGKLRVRCRVGLRRG